METSNTKKRKVTRQADNKEDGPQLELIPQTCAQLPVWLIERLYYRPRGGYRKTLTASEEKRRRLDGRTKIRFLIEDVWSAEETIVNKSLETLLMAAPPVAVAETVNSLAPGAELKSPQVCKIRRPSRARGYVGEPDFILWDPKQNSLVIGEIKIGAKPTNGQYSFQQLQKYMQLGLLAKSVLKLRQVRHLIVLPDEEIARHCEDTAYWEPSIDKTRRLSSRVPQRFLTMAAVYTQSGEALADLLPLDVGDFIRPIDRSAPLLPITTYVTSWERLCRKLAAACTATGADHLVESCDVLQQLGSRRIA